MKYIKLFESFEDDFEDEEEEDFLDIFVKESDTVYVNTDELSDYIKLLDDNAGRIYTVFFNSDIHDKNALNRQEHIKIIIRVFAKPAESFVSLRGMPISNIANRLLERFPLITNIRPLVNSGEIVLRFGDTVKRVATLKSKNKKKKK